MHCSWIDWWSKSILFFFSWVPLCVYLGAFFCEWNWFFLLFSYSFFLAFLGGFLAFFGSIFSSFLCVWRGVISGGFWLVFGWLRQIPTKAPWQLPYPPIFWFFARLGHGVARGADCLDLGCLGASSPDGVLNCPK